MQKLIRSAMDATGFQHLTLHVLRYSTAGKLINNKVAPYTVGAIFGHNNARTPKRYAHLAVHTLGKRIVPLTFNAHPAGR
ncbi:MAG: tyrosine-type recombinase/integrase [Pseudomonadota bacterium]